METDATRELLLRWHADDAGALDALLEQNIDWIRAHVRKRLGEALRAKAETDDFVQEAVIEMLRYGPRFVVESRAQFRALLATIVENVLRGKHQWFHRRRRAVAKEQPLDAGSVLDLDHPTSGGPTPSQAAVRQENEAWIRLALELVGPEERELIMAREWDRRSFADIGSELGIEVDAARMRFQRAVGKLARLAKQLRDGRLEDVIG